MLNNSVHSADLALSSVPLYLGGGVEPNIMFTLDDSGSMQMEHMGLPSTLGKETNFYFPRPLNLYGAGPNADDFNDVASFEDTNIHNFYGRSSHNNAIFYNPDKTYIPWSNSDGSLMADADPTHALYNPTILANGGLDLTSQQSEVACWVTPATTLIRDRSLKPCNTSQTYWPITYFNYTNGLVTDRASYTKVVINNSSPGSYTSPSGTVRTKAEEIQNFANWFQYYRSRILTARAGIGRAFSKQSDKMRVGFAALNKGCSTKTFMQPCIPEHIDGGDPRYPTGTLVIQNGVRPFSGQDRNHFFDTLYTFPISGLSTPGRKAIGAVGRYFQRSDSQGPWSETPGTVSSENPAEHLSCRQNYNILLTDGDSVGPFIGPYYGVDENNSDNTAGSTITGPNNQSFTYQPGPPYQDNWGHSITTMTLADVAMHYWKHDLRTDLVNNVPVNASDDAFWQHLVNFTIGFGVNGTLDPAVDYPALKAGLIDWPEPTTEATRIDNLWHTAINSRGDYFSVSDPDVFADSLAGVLSTITDRASAASAVTVDSGTISSSSKLYQGKFEGGTWTGQLLAYPFNADGSLGSSIWNAADFIPSHTNRTIITSEDNTGTGQPFRWTNISSNQQASLSSEAVLNYLRGDQSQEESHGGIFRNRISLLGDIINSSPRYVGAPSEFYLDNWGAGAAENLVPYSTFISTNHNRAPLVYVGANDGMLHSFDADTGVEKFAYIPRALYERIPDLADVNYNHKYYVDSSPVIRDAFFNSAWHTVLVSGLRGGGQGVFALDVTDPSSFNNETSAATKVLWEFTDSDDADLGYVYGPPSIMRMNNGKWAAIFSGGYNNTVDNGNDGATHDSTSGTGAIYIVDIADGSLIKKFDTETGKAQDPTGNQRPNGLAQPQAADFNADQITDAIYVGDLFGNVWKIDVSASNEISWDFSYHQGNSPLPIYTACSESPCTATNHQPITTIINVAFHPSRLGYMLIFGTGQYIEIGDNVSTGQITQSMYGIWDRHQASLTSFDRGDLLQQQIIKEVDQHNASVRVTTDNAINWYNGLSGHLGWYLDLVNTESGNTDNKGERQISNTSIRGSHLIFSTLIPSDDPCNYGGTGYLMVLDVNTGARLAYTPFDLSGDGVFSSTDYINIGDIDGDGNDDYAPATGIRSKQGVISSPAIVRTGAGIGRIITTTSDTDASGRPIEITNTNFDPSNFGRQSWRQLDFNF